MNPFTALRASLHFTSLHFSSLVLSNLHFTLLCYSYLHLTSLHFLSPSLPLKYFILLRHHSTLSELKDTYCVTEVLSPKWSTLSLLHQRTYLNRKAMLHCVTKYVAWIEELSLIAPPQYFTWTEALCFIASPQIWTHVNTKMNFVIKKKGDGFFDNLRKYCLFGDIISLKLTA